MIPACSGFFTPRNDSGGGGTTARYAYVANFNGGGSGTISGFNLNTTTGALTLNGQAASTGISGNGPAAVIVVLGKFLYSANDAGSVSAFSIADSTGVLTAISGSPFPAGISPSALASDPAGKFLYVANTGSDSINAYSIDATTGGLTALGTVNLNGGPAGLAVHPTGKFLYAAIDSQGIDAFTIATNGSLTLIRNVPPLLNGRPQAIAIESTGKYLYAADGVSGVEFFTINATTGDLTSARTTPFPAGTGPVAITTDAASKFVYVANQDSNNVSGYAILSDGSLTALSGSPYAVGTSGANPSPIAIKMDPSSKFVYTTNFNGNPSIAIFTLDTVTAGRLLTPPATATSGANPAGIAFK
ncbi:MAG TPA: beta-propeller fold lactonase family protein [Terriglobales bacterium]|nr:beta-propeller fold lactonase family protein [Terriglobales bacterium]